MFRTKRVKKSKIRSYQKKPLWYKWMIKYRLIFHIGFIASLVIAWLLLLSFVLQRTIFSSKYMIRDVTYSATTTALFDDPYLYAAVTNAFSWENYYRTTWFTKDDIVSDLQEEYTLIDSLQIEQEDQNTIHITMSFFDPTLVFITPNQRVAIFEEQFYFLVSWNTLWEQSLQLELPSYTSWTSLQGIFYQIDEYELKRIADTVHTTLWSQHISSFIYLPWGKLFFIVYKGKTIYFNLEQDINIQLAKLIDIENRYEWFETLERIDLWSVEDSIVR